MTMTFAELPTIIQIHAAAAILALALGPFALWRKRRDRVHRWVGAIWILLMLTVATTAWFINTIRLIGPFSPIHVFSLLTYGTLFVALRHVRAGRYHAHGVAMRSLYLQALGVAGVFTLLPGRAMHQILFGDQQALAVMIMVAVGVALVVLLRRAPRLHIVR